MIKLGLYSVAYSGTWFKGGLSLEGFIDRAKKFGFDGVEIDLKRPHGFPGDLDNAKCKAIKDYVKAQGLEISAVAGNNNFSSPVRENLENELLMLKEQIRVAKELGAPLLRVFASWRGVTIREGIASYDIAAKYFNYMDSTKNEVHDRVVACLSEGVKWAEAAGVVLVLQNHPPVTDTYMHMLNFVKEVNSPFLQCCLDAPNCGYYNQSDEYITKAANDVGKLQRHTHASGEFELDANGNPVLIPWEPEMIVSNYPALIKAMKKNGVDGYVSYEFCHVPRKNGKTLGIEYIDEQVGHAVKYFRKLIQEA